ncbi:hypothetical protein VN12_03490 [Pirellula sp. SH-Sr6A]|uniref:DUF4350 domain-containing protein n=1 Tax=Pirellula sp. SH-Sr6A TaxID=1632865 RepID=UPI00078C0D78|nr:DUF4350 domain-containing protein [Pirellula sp. SH-Sr6A]AMV31155.1 hypothetical protein VN12_03490 [Pirellula sp. SH-Sr6A]
MALRIKSTQSASDCWFNGVRLLLFCVGASLAFGGDPDDKSSQDSQRHAPPRVLADAYHSHTWIETLPAPGMNNYHLLHGPARAFSALRQQGWECKSQLGPWTDDALRNTDVVYINLVSADLPPFHPDEIDALERFVSQGGGLFLIIDHSNCYFHNHVLGNLADRFDLKLHQETLCDRPPHTVGDGNAWIVLSDIRPHPATHSVQQFVMMTGGIVDQRMGVVYSSSDSWGDAAVIPPYGESNGPGFYGDFQKQPAEVTGPHAAIGAKEWGKGRVFLVGDQNAFGAFAFNYLDNRQLWFSAMHWLAKQEVGSSSDSHRQEALPGLALVWCREPGSDSPLRFADGGKNGLYHFFAWINKIADARGTQRSLRESKVLILPDEHVFRTHKDTREILDYMQQPERTVVILSNTPSSPEQVVALPWSEWRQISIPSLNETLGTHHAWEHPSGSKLVWFQNDKFLNSNFPAPEIPIPPPSQPFVDSLMNFLAEQGVEWGGDSSTSADWLDELDR